MIARMTEAAIRPEPLGTPDRMVSQIEPGGAMPISGSSIYLANSGASTNRPHMP